ncbi:MAG: hypothetical protein ACLR5H_14385 [Oscillospiraceae bacterium]
MPPTRSGKSTWCSFIRTMLYGLPTRQSGPLADKNRFAPWTGEAMQGRMDLETGGQRWTVLRDTRRAGAPMQNFACTYTGTAQPVPEVNGQNLGETLLGVPGRYSSAAPSSARAAWPSARTRSWSAGSPPCCPRDRRTCPIPKAMTG